MQRLSNKQKLWLTIIIAGIALVLQYGFHYPLLAQIIVTIAGAIVAFTMFIGMVKTLRSGKYGVDLLAILAVVATLAVGEYWAAMVILVMLTGGDALEDYAAKKANTELKALLDNSPRFAHLVTPSATQDVPVNDVPVGSQIIVKPGELVPIDGTIIEGSGEFDESSLTGEARPVAKTVGDAVMSGSLNGDEAITLKVTKLAKDSQYQQLVKLVREAEQTPAHFVRLADRYAVPFTIAAILISLFAWWFSKDPRRFAEVLVVASPCPLILAAPVAMVSGMSRASRNGIVVKTGSVLEKLAGARTGAFDKTGTITNGHLTVAQILPAGTITKERLLHLAASAEQDSSHILARSLLAYANQHSISLAAATGLTEETGRGITAMIEDHQVKVGKRQFVAPQNQQAALQSIPQAEHPVFMVGDGVNDAPSLATADVGIAMGAHGSTAASETADVVILKDDLAKVAKAVNISQDTLRIAKQAVLIGIAICTVLMLIASTGVIPAFVGAMLQEVIDTVSILWALKARQLHN